MADPIYVNEKAREAGYYWVQRRGDSVATIAMYAAVATEADEEEYFEKNPEAEDAEFAEVQRWGWIFDFNIEDDVAVVSDESLLWIDKARIEEPSRTLPPSTQPSERSETE